MFNTKTLFVVGAGASNEVGLPLGGSLLETIAREMDYHFEFRNTLASGNRVLFDTWQNRYREDYDTLNAVIAAARKIHLAYGFANSIDQFIDTHHTDELVAFCGKCAIALFILGEEQQSDLMVDPSQMDARLELDKLDESWFVAFSKMLFEGVRIDQISTLFDNISIVCFNYDRCIEHFLIHAITLHYQIEIDEARRLVSESLSILHPYGLVGDLTAPNTPGGVTFGQHLTRENLIEVSGRINTFTEQRDQGTMDAIKAEVSEAETIVFLGFGFLPDNMDILTPAMGTNVGRVFATAFGESAPNRSDIEKALWRLLSVGSDGGPFLPGPAREGIMIEDEMSWQILSTYRRALSQ